MKKMFTKSQLLNLAVMGVTILGMVLTSKAQDQDMKDLKSEIKKEIKEEQEA